MVSTAAQQWSRYHGYQTQPLNIQDCLVQVFIHLRNANFGDFKMIEGIGLKIVAL
jgi:hypothetical protein